MSNGAVGINPADLQTVVQALQNIVVAIGNVTRSIDQLTQAIQVSSGASSGSPTPRVTS
jgi:uncharacterized protein YoxC